MEVLSKMLDKGAYQRKFRFHPKCKGTHLTHLCFADDLMIFTDGKLRSIKGVLSIFKDFSNISGLHISLEKSVIYSAGIPQGQLQSILQSCQLSQGDLPVRYLGLPLLTKRMTATDYAPLIEKIKTRISSWKNRFLSYAGRLLLIRSVIGSLINFWISVFQLPKRCLQEVESICMSFLWSGPNMDKNKAKVAWTDICKPKKEGGLGVKDLREANKVSNLNLVWRLISHQKSLWANWVRANLLRGNTFWNTSDSNHLGSWTWRKLVKLKSLAMEFHKVKVNNGQTTSFWFDNWFTSGNLFALLGPRGRIDLGISLNATVGEAMDNFRIRHHRSDLLNQLQNELHHLKSIRQIQKPDNHLWQSSNQVFKPFFNSRTTWEVIRTKSPVAYWHRAIWFPFSTPKHCFIAWLAMRNRLPTGYNIQQWNPRQDTTCKLCSAACETRDHIFFECSFSMQIWAATTSKLMLANYSCQWEHISYFISHLKKGDTNAFLLRSAFQSSIYHLWRERNNRLHGRTQSSPELITRIIDKDIRNHLSIILTQSTGKHSDGFQVWFHTR